METIISLILMYYIGDPETRMIEVCDSVRMETYYISCADRVHKDSTITFDSQRRYFLDECVTQSRQVHCSDSIHILIKGEWINCRTLSKRKQKMCQ